MSDVAYQRNLDLIYDVATSSDRWPELLNGLGEQFRCHFVGAVSSTADRTVAVGRAIGVDAADHKNYLARYHGKNEFRIAAPPKYNGHIVDSRAILSRAALERTEMYQAFYRPNDLGHGLRLTIFHDDFGAQTVALIRSWRAEPFDGDDLKRVHGLLPHLQRMARMSRHLREANLAMHAAGAALDTVRLPVLLLNRAGRLVRANAAAENLLDAGDGLSVGRGGALLAASGAATRQLSGMIAAAAARPGTGGSMRLPRPSGAAPLAAIATPIRDVDGFALVEDPVVCLGIVDPARANDQEAALLMELFHLTRAEAAVARQLLAGQDLKSIAEESGRSFNTVRSLLARVLDKTETRRQSDLIRLLGHLPRSSG